MNHTRNLLKIIDKLRAAHTGTTHGTTTKASGGESSPLPGAGHAENQARENIPHYIEIADAIEADRKERESITRAKFESEC
tara:strand:- start:301 stop:543 length:243 start_codon:yes stop_codon:yes gene_type:complete